MSRRRQTDPWQVVQEAVRHWYWMPLAVLALGLASILLLLGSGLVRRHLLEEDIALVRSVGGIQSGVAIAHLWIEEHVSGDEVDLETVERHLEGARQSIEAIQASLAGTRARPLGRSADRPTLPSLAGRIRSQLLSFAALTDDRRRGYAAGREVGIGSAVDVEYDRVFARLLADLDELERALEARLGESESRSRRLQLAIVGAWTLIVGFAVTGLWTRERRRMRAEEALRRSQLQLLQAQKMEAVGRLAGGLAHDINNYLAAISAQCELVRMKAGDDAPTAEKMDAVLATAGRASTLIRQLLAFSRRQPARPEAIDLNRTVRGMEKLLRRLLGEDVELETHLEPGLWAVQIDGSQAEQVLLNLAVNAREAMPEGGRLRIETRNVGASGAAESVILKVTDTGTGIDEAIRDKIFDPFFTTKDPSLSSGLGLSTVVGIVEQNGGEVRLESSPGGGSTFEVRLPRTAEPASEVPAAKAPEQPETGARERLLLVEDNPELRDSTCQILEALGYEVSAVADAHRALELFDRGGPFDLVVTDVVMPGMSGKRLAAHLRRRRSNLPVLFISGHTDSVVLRHGIESGHADLLQKPFDASELGRAVRAALDRAGRG